jgi:hypothetical protein
MPARTQSQRDKVAQIKALNIPGIRIAATDNSVYASDIPVIKGVRKQLKAY